MERFNFYDVYGYLLPGGLLLVFVWIPVGVLTGIWPPAAWSSALLGLALAYVVGHILSSLAEAGLPAEFKDKKGKKRYPSDLLWDEDVDQVLTKKLGDLQKAISQQIEDDFQIKVAVGAAWDDKVKQDRSNAFLRCRNLLVRQKVADYAEQQQGMYVVMRGTAAALLLTSATYAGMTIGFWIPPSGSFLRLIMMILLGITGVLLFLTAIRSCRLQNKRHTVRKWPRNEKAARGVMFQLVLLALFSTGLLLAKPVRTLTTSTPEIPMIVAKSVDTQLDAVKYREMEEALNALRLARQVRSHAEILLTGWALMTGFLFLVCLAVYRNFAVNFPMTVYRDYSNAHVLVSTPGRSPGSD
jgi:hypothetical protein